MRLLLVAGTQANSVLSKEFTPNMGVEVVSTFTDVTSLISELYTGGVSFLNNIDSILLIDYGFDTSDEYERLEQFVELQDILNSNGLDEDSTKLYFVTKNSDLYKMVQKNDKGIPGILYINAEVMLITGGYITKTLVDIAKGRKDRYGLYHEDAGKNNRHSRLVQDKESFIKDNRAISEETLNFGKDVPYSDFHKEDYVDSDYTNKKIIEKERAEEKARRERERELQKKQQQGKKGGRKRHEEPQGLPQPVESIPSMEYDDSHEIEELTDVEDDYYSQYEVSYEEDGIEVEELGTQSVEVDEEREVETLKRLRKAVDKKRLHGYVLPEKLSTATGVITVVGDVQTGKSGVVANLAEIYALASRNVLIIDTDVVNRQQSVYYNNYSKLAKETGMSDGLIKACRGGGITRTSVKITSRLSVLGVGRDVRWDEDDIELININIAEVVEEARNYYDIVIIDTENTQSLKQMLALRRVTDNYLLVISDLKYRNDVYFSRVVQSKYAEDKFMIDIYKKTKIVVNKISRNHEISNMEPFYGTTFEQWLRQKGSPYDKMYVIGEIPYYDMWETQYVTNRRYVWKDKLALYTYADMINKLL